jgi:hypothetical protein
MAFVPTFTDFSQVYRLLQTFIDFFEKKCFLVLFKFIEFTDFYRYAPKFTSFLYRLAVNRLP